MNFLERLKRDLTGDSGARFVLVNDFEVEHAWAARGLRLEAERRLREPVEAGT